MKMTFAKAINDALHVAMKSDSRVLCFGLGVGDPKEIFGTTTGLQKEFGSSRVFDMPTSENGMTGIAIGAALGGLIPVMSHQRLDFFLLALDQLINNAAKWNFMFGSQGGSVPLTIRLILGRGWGQGPTHSQNLQSCFAHIPGLKVVMPATPQDAKGLLLSSIFDPNPVLYLEHRWLHESVAEVPEGDYRVPLGEAQRLAEGDEVTIVSMSYMTVEALHALPYLKNASVRADLIDLRSIAPMDWPMILKSVAKTGRLLVLDTASKSFSVASEIVSRVSQEAFSMLKAPPRILACPDFPSPTSPALTRHYYPGAAEILKELSILLGRDIDGRELEAARKNPHDVPGDWFKGPF